MKKPIPTYAHGIFDYVGGIALLFAPEIFAFSHLDGAAVVIPRVLGVIVIVQSLLTKYEVGLIKLLPMRLHLVNDYVASIFLAMSPWLFGFANQPANAWVPHLVVGITVFIVSLLTQKEAYVRSRLRGTV